MGKKLATALTRSDSGDRTGLWENAESWSPGDKMGSVEFVQTRNKVER